MNRTRIRWRNVARLALAVLGGGALLALLPGLLEPPEAPPLPPDVGLATGATGGPDYAGAPPSPPRAANDQPPRAQRQSARPEHQRDGEVEKGPARPLRPARKPVSAPAPGPAPTSIVSAPAPTPAPAGGPSAAPPTPPIDAASPEPSPPQPPTSTPPQPPEFGFEH